MPPCLLPHLRLKTGNHLSLYVPTTQLDLTRDIAEEKGKLKPGLLSRLEYLRHVQKQNTKHLGNLQDKNGIAHQDPLFLGSGGC